jgi:hypothetical protein
MGKGSVNDNRSPRVRTHDPRAGIEIDTHKDLDSSNRVYAAFRPDVADRVLTHELLGRYPFGPNRNFEVFGKQFKKAQGMPFRTSTSIAKWIYQVDMAVGGVHWERVYRATASNPAAGERRLFPLGWGGAIAIHLSQFQKCEKASLLRAVASLFL